MKPSARSPFLRFWLPAVLAAAGLAAWGAGVAAGLAFWAAGDPVAVVLSDGPGRSAGYLLDPSGGLRREEVAAKPAGEFTPLGEGRVTVPPAEARVAWVRVEWTNDSGALQVPAIELMSVVDRLEAFVPREGGWVPHVAGQAVPVSRRTAAQSLLGVPLPVAPGARETLLLRLEDSAGLSLRFQVWPDAGRFFAADRADYALQLVYLGMLAGLWLYNFLLFTRVGERVLGGYLVYLFLFGAAMVVSADIIPLESVWRVGLRNGLFTLSCAALLGFSRRFLDLKTCSPRGDRVLRAAFWVLAAWVPAGLATPVLLRHFAGMVAVMSVCWLAACVLAAGAGVLAWRRGAPQAGWFVAAFGLLLLCVLPGVAGAVFGFEIGLAEGYLLYAGSLLEMSVLAFALAERFRAMRAERERLREDYARRLEEEVAERTRELELSNRQKDRLFAIIGHDLRGPVSAVMQTARVLGRRGGAVSAEEVADRSGEIEAAGREVVGLLDNLLDWARLQTGEVACAPCVFRTGEVAEAVRRQLASVARSGGVELRNEIAAESEVRADPAMFETILRNLAANALKATPAGGVVTFAACSGAGGGTVVEVRDTGAGLAAERLAELGLDEAGEPAATEGRRGLGLVVCRELLALHGGRLRAESRPGAGSRFYFSLRAWA